MTITAIKGQVKNPRRVSLFVDGKYSFSLSLDQLLEQKLKKGFELDDIELTRLRTLSDEGKWKAKALDWLMMRPHSTRELRDYGYRKQIEKELIELWVEEFTAKKYLNDEAFARWFVENRVRKNKSTRAIIAELGTKGIARAVAEPIVAELTSDTDSLKKLILKLQTRPRYKDEQKLIANLAQRGFRYDEIKTALNSLHS